jgi:regulator of RNase E activity RraA
MHHERNVMSLDIASADLKQEAPDTPAPLSPRTRDALLRVSTATITTQLMSRGYRNTYLEGLTFSNPSRQRMVGEAFTMRCIPAREDIDVPEIFQDYDHPQRTGVESVQPGQVLVVDSRGRKRAASLGHILATRLKMRGAEGIVTDGSLRDMAGFEELDLPTFSAGASPTTNLAQHHVVDVQVPIGCAEVPVYPGDIMVGDRDGVVCIPRHLAEEVARDALEQERLEEFILEQIEDGKPLRGTYPPNDEMRQAYRDSLSRSTE